MSCHLFKLLSVELSLFIDILENTSSNAKYMFYAATEIKI